MAEKTLPTNAILADQFELIGDLLEIGGEKSRHRLLAYRRGAARIRGAGESVAAMALAGRATELPDIGGTLQDKVREYVETGTIGALERLRSEIPEGLAHVARLQGIGPKRARLVWESLGVTDLDGLRAAAAAGTLAGVQGIGPKLVAQVEEQLAAREAGAVPDTLFPLGRALPVAESLVSDLAGVPGVAQIAIAGGLRRGRDQVHDIDVAVGTDDPEAFVAAATTHPLVTERVSGAAAGVAVMTQTGIRAEFRIGPPESFGNLLQHLSGSKAHNIRLRELAVKQRLSISEHGLTDTTDGEVFRYTTEDELYARLGLAYIPPELREDTGEIDVAAVGELPTLVTEDDLLGDLHTHSTWSDGRATIAAMVDAARTRGLAYIAVSDHSKALAMAGGLDEDRVRRQWDEIAEIQASRGDIAILRATEVDVLSDGRLDHDDDLLAEFDWVTASLHSGFTQGSARITARILAAIDNPAVNVIGHPTGRMLGRREGYAFDMDRVLTRAAETGTALEINAQPRRLDLTADLARRALAAGVRLTIGTDAHGVEEFGFRRFGVLVARRAGATRSAILNTRPWDELRALRAQALG
jgi:DNA polymerase (family 10)